MTSSAIENIHVFAIAEYFRIEQKNYRIIPVKTGHINDTYFLQADDLYTPEYVLQQINHFVFRDVEKLMENIVRVTMHIESMRMQKKSPKPFLKAVPTFEGQYYVHDKDGKYWRCYNYIPHHPMSEKAMNSEIAKAGGIALGEFQTMLHNLPGRPLHETIPFFHSISQRYLSFEKALKNADEKRVNSALPEITFLKSRISSLVDFDTLHQLPVRITHNDTKFNNILFDDGGHALSLIDLDTVMNGYVLYDFGDAIRTLASTTSEDENDVGLVQFRFDLFAAFTQGYLESTRNFLTRSERDLLAFSTKLMTYMIGLRFLTDFLEGDIYYRTCYPYHNLVRARNQIAYLLKLEENYKRMQTFINEYFDN